MISVFFLYSLQCNLGWLGAKEEVPARSCDSGTAAGCWWTIWSVTCAPSDNEHLETGSTLMKHFKFQRMAPHITYRILVRVILKSQIIPNIY